MDSLGPQEELESQGLQESPDYRDQQDKEDNQDNQAFLVLVNQGMMGYQGSQGSLEEKENLVHQACLGALVYLAMANQVFLGQRENEGWAACPGHPGLKEKRVMEAFLEW